MGRPHAADFIPLLFMTIRLFFFMALAPIVETGWEPVLKEAKLAETPVVLVGRGVDVADDRLYAMLIASDFDAVAKAVAGEELPKLTVVEDHLFEASQAEAELPNRKY